MAPSTSHSLGPPPTDHPYFNEPPPVRLTRIKALFKKLDVQNRSVLDAQSIILALENHSLHSLPAFNKYARDLLIKCDTSRDGVIDFDEFRAYIEQKERELWRAFEEVDTSGDHLLDTSEVAAALGGAGIYVSEDELEQFMDAMDTNADGKISFEEWRDFLTLLPAPATIREIFQFYSTFATASSQLTPDAEALYLPVAEGSQKSHSALRYLLAGAIAGAVSRTATAPFDRLKTHLITTPINFGNRAALVRSSTLVKATRLIYSEGGLRAFFVGNGLNVAKITPESAIKFYTFETVKAFLAHATGAEDNNSIGLPERLIAGGAAGIVSQFFIYPVETLKTRIQCANPKAPGSRSVIASTAREMLHGSGPRSGPRSFYSGLVLGLIGVFPYQALDMGIYETMKVGYHRYLATQAEKMGEEGELRPSAFVTLGMGTVSGSIGASSVYPLSVVRTKLQAQGTPRHPETYNSAIDCFVKTYRAEGYRGFYKGLAPTLFKVVPAVSLSYVVYEWSKRTLGIS